MIPETDNEEKLKAALIQVLEGSADYWEWLFQNWMDDLSPAADILGEPLELWQKRAWRCHASKPSSWSISA